MAKIGSKLINLTDRQLVCKALEGNQGAYSVLLEKYQIPLRNFISGFIPDTEDTDDICQRSFAKAFEKLERYNPAYEFSTWLYSIAQNETIDYIRKHRCAINSISLNEKNESLTLNTSRSPEEKMIEAQTAAELMNGIKNLPEEYRKIAELRFINDYPYQEIAQTMQIPIGTVKTRLNRARKYLSSIIKDNNGTNT